MTADPRRPALAAVLSTLTPRHRVWWEMAIADYGPLSVEGWMVRGRYGEGHPFDVHALDLGEGESLRRLRSAGLLPPDDPRRAWPYDPRLGDVPLREHARFIGGPYVPGEAVAPPPRVAVLVSVASLGADLWLRAEDLAREASPGAVVVWGPPWVPTERLPEGVESRQRSLARECGVVAVRAWRAAGEGVDCVQLAAPWEP